MWDIIIETKRGSEEISEDIAEKYNLKQGDLSPFTQSRIVGTDGDFQSENTADHDSEAWIRQDFKQMPEKGIPDDEIDHMDNGFEFSQSEIIDFSQGVDSD
jgi:hypothetical protein